MTASSVSVVHESRLDHTGAAFLEALEHMTVGWSQDDIEAVARAWHVTNAEISVWKNNREAKSEEERLRIETATAVLAAGGERAFLNRGQVLTPAILEAEPEQLLGFIEYYERECDQLYKRAAQLAAPLDDPAESVEYLRVRHKFDRLAGFLWEARTQSGVWNVHHPQEEAS